MFVKLSTKELNHLACKTCAKSFEVAVLKKTGLK